MRGLSRIGAALVGLGLWVLPGAVAAQGLPLRAPLAAEVRYSDALGRALEQVTPGQPFRIDISFTAQVGSLPETLEPLAWIRDKDDSDLSCRETAAAYRATGRAALGSVALNGILLGVLAQDGAFTVLDPQRSLGTANLIAAHRFDPLPAAIAADPGTGAFLLAQPGKTAGQGRVLAFSPQGDLRVLIQGLDRPAALVPAESGGAWVLDTGRGDLLRLRAEGRQTWALAGQEIVGDAGDGPARRLALRSRDQVMLVEDGQDPRGFAAPGVMAIGLSSQALLWLAPGALHLRWLDAAATEAAPIALDGAFDRMAVSPEGRMVLLYARDRTGFAVVDLARGQVVQGADTDSPIAEIAFLPQTAVLRLANGASVGVMDLREVRPGQEMVLGRVALGPPGPRAEAARLLAPLLPEPAMLAVHGPSYTGFVLDQRNAVSGKPPMEAMRLRGGIPYQVQALDRGLRPQGGGRYATSALLPGPGRWELVVSAGLGQGAFCSMVPTPADPGANADAAADAPGRIIARAKADGTVQLLFLTPAGQPAPALSGTLDLAALIGGWRQRQDFVTDAQGMAAAPPGLAAHLPLVVTLRGDPGFDPLVLEQMP